MTYIIKRLSVLLASFLSIGITASELHFRTDGQGVSFVVKGGARFEDSALKLDGISGFLQLPNSQDCHIGKEGLTIYAVVKLIAFEKDSKKKHEMFLWKENEFLLGRIGSSLYFNFYDGKAWKGMTIGGLLPTDEWIHVAAIVRCCDIAQGSGYEVELYLNGKMIVAKRFDGALANSNEKVIEIGKGWGNLWFMKGELSEAKVCDRPLTRSELIAEMRSNTKVAEKCPKIISALSPAFDKEFTVLVKQAESIGTEERSKVLRLISAVKGWATIPSYNQEASSLLSKLKSMLQSNLRIIENFDSRLSFKSNKRLSLAIISDPQRKNAALVDIYDLKADRTVLAKPFSWELGFFGTKSVLSPSSEGVTAEAEDIAEGVILKWRGSQTTPFEAKTTILLVGENRAELSFSIDNNTRNILADVTFPALRLASLTRGKDRLFVPVFEGEVHSNPIKENYLYNRWYPSGGASMQYIAYYDEAGGIYVASEDSMARTKNIQISSADGHVDLDYIWPAGGNSFTVSGKIALELFDGDWYDAAQIYKRWLPEAKWWVPLPRQDTPVWYKDNPLCFMGGMNELLSGHIREVQKYFDLQVAFHCYSWEDRDNCNSYSPGSRPANANLKKILANLPNQVKVKAYVNNRIWTMDMKDEGYEYEGKGSIFACKKPDGSVYEEIYARKFAVMCPAAKGWQDFEQKIFHRVASYGFDALYFDQTVAGAPKQCFDKTHGHSLGGDVWLEKGYWQMLLPLRTELKKQHPDIVLESEDLCEAYMHIFDGFLPWRAFMFNEPVPAFQAVYGGRIQFVGYSYGSGTLEGWFAKASKQLLTGEQIGWFGIANFGNPLYAEFGLLVKRLAHLRLTLLPFFNAGEMARPLTWKTPMKRQCADWGYYGPRMIESDTIQHSVWRLGNQAVLLFVNATNKSASAEPVIDGVRLGLADGPLTLKTFPLEGAFTLNEQPNHFFRELKLPPYSIAVWVVEAKGLSSSKAEKRFAEQIEKLRTFKPWPSPIYPPVLTLESGQWNEAVKIPLYFGMALKPDTNCLGGVFDNALAYLGQADMGAVKKLELQVGIKKESAGGSVELRLDSPEGPTVCTVSLAQSTAGWTDFAIRSAPLGAGITGVHKLFLVFHTPQGFGVCYLKAWRFVAD